MSVDSCGRVYESDVSSLYSSEGSERQALSYGGSKSQAAQAQTRNKSKQVERRSPPKFQATSSPKLRKSKHVVLPSELQTLDVLDRITIKEKVKLLSVVSVFQATTEFNLQDPETNELLFVATEHSGCCAKHCCKWARPFDMRVRLHSGEPMFVAVRKFKCCVWLRFCDCLCANYFERCRDHILVYGNHEAFFGSVQEVGSCVRPRYNVYNCLGMVQFRIIGPLCMFTLGCCRCCPRSCRKVTFKVYDAKSDELVGNIYKQFSGLLKEVITDADNFGIEFPESIDVTMKAVLLSAVFFIDMIHFNTRN